MFHVGTSGGLCHDVGISLASRLILRWCSDTGCWHYAFTLRGSGARVLVTECDPFGASRAPIQEEMVAIETVMSGTLVFFSNR